MGGRAKALIAVAVVVAVLVGGALWWWFRDDSPSEVSLEAAVESVEPTTSVLGADDAPAVAGVEGTWTVDAETGEFDYESATGTFAGFRIQEELASIGSSTAVGRTGDVGGQITIDGTTLTAASVEVDLTAITTNESRRDDRVQSALDTTDHPTATFVLTAPVELGAGVESGASIAVTASGDLTIHGVTHPVEWPLEAQLVDGTVVVVGSLDISFADYDVEVPRSPAVVSAEDHGIVELQLLLTRS